MKKSIYTLLLSFAALTISAKTIYFNPGGVWNIDNPVFFVYSWGSSSAEAKLELLSGDVYSADIPDANNNLLFVRMPAGSTALDWNSKWNQTGDLTLPADKNCYTITGWGDFDGTWSSYTPPACPETYGLLIDGVYLPCKRNLLQSQWTEFMVRDVELNANQTIQLYDSCNAAAWVVDNFAQTSFTFPIVNNKYVVEEAGTYDFYIKFIYGADELYVSKHGTYTTAVRDQCTDVMMQAFFNESYSDDAPGVSATKDYKLGLGNTRWTTLTAQAEEIGRYFDLVWLPPSSYGDGMGYHPKQYSNQNSNWGSAAELTTLINALHEAGAKVVADVVINHCAGWSSWCDFPEMDFGKYGVFHPDASYICRTDEVNLNPEAGDCYGKATGNDDDGQNWDGARDWSHDNVYVQEMFKAYLQWLRYVIGYDGFRYDKGDGFNNWHHDNYNKAAGPYIAFMECYSGTDEIQGRIAQANYNLMGLDFDLKWHVFNAFAGWDYSHGRGDCIMSRGDGRHSVTFIDSHDWFLRDDNENEFGGRGNSLTEPLRARLMQANAFMLSMPGIPCVFYPHWAKYKHLIKPMIEARKYAGVHSESEVLDEYSEAEGYQATIHGKDGYLILMLGNKVINNNPKPDWLGDYQLMSSYYETNDANMRKNASYEMWVNRTTPVPTDIDNTPLLEEGPGEVSKYLKGGHLFIERNNHTYTITGQRIQ